MTASGSTPFIVPPKLHEGMERFGSVEWLESLPARVDEAAGRWGLAVGDPFVPGGLTSWVAPARTSRGDDLVLKITWAHDEGLHEPEGLATWNGDGAVQLHAHGEVGDAGALLLERCVPGTPLKDRDESQQDEVIAGLLRRLWMAPSDSVPFRPLSDMCDQWVAEFEQKEPAAGCHDLDPGLIGTGLALFRELARAGPGDVLLCTDLHAGNVLASRREPWLMIDPKPYVGDPAYDVLQHLLNCEERLVTDPRGAAHRMANLLDLDRDRVERWLFARCVVELKDRQDLRQVAIALAPR